MKSILKAAVWYFDDIVQSPMPLAGLLRLGDGSDARRIRDRQSHKRTPYTAPDRKRSPLQHSSVAATRLLQPRRRRLSFLNALRLAERHVP